MASRHYAGVDVMDLREDAIPVSRPEKQNDELEKLLKIHPPAAHPRTSQPPSESDYDSVPHSPNSFQTATSAFEQE